MSDKKRFHARPRPEDAVTSAFDQQKLVSRLYRAGGEKFRGHQQSSRIVQKRDYNESIRFANSKPTNSIQEFNNLRHWHHSAERRGHGRGMEEREKEQVPEGKGMKVSTKKRLTLLQAKPVDTRNSEVEVPRSLQGLMGERKHVRQPVIQAHTAYDEPLNFSSRAQLPATRETLDRMKHSLTSVRIQEMEKDEHAVHGGSVRGSRRSSLQGAQRRSSSVSEEDAEDAVEETRLTKQQEEKQAYSKYLKSPFSFIDKVIESPYTEEFVYLNPRGAYNLEIVKHNEIQVDNYYTMSRAGVTHFFQTETDFTSLDQWEREYFLFTKMMHIPFFNKFRMWKGFFFWKKLIRRYKTSKCCKFLNENSYILNPYLRGSLINLRKACWHVGKWMVYRVDPRNTLTLEMFKAAQSSQKEAISQNLEDLNQQARSIVLKACDIDLHQFLIQNGFRKSKSEEAQDLDDDYPQKISHAEKAAIRTKCRKLTKYIRLADYFIQTTLMALSIDRTAELLMYVEARSPLQLELLEKKDEPVEEKVATRSMRGMNKETKVQAKPLFSVELILDEEKMELVFEPSLAEFQQQIEAGVDSAVRRVMSPKRLIDDKELSKLYTNTNDNDDDDEQASELKLEQMVLTDDNFQIIKRKIKKGLSAAFADVNEFAKNFHWARDMYIENSKTDIQAMRDVNIPTLSKMLNEFKRQVEELSQIVTSSTIGIVAVETKRLREALVPSPKRCLAELADLLPDVGREKTEVLLEELKHANAQISHIPANVDEFVLIMGYLNDVQENDENVVTRNKYIEELYALMKEHNIKILEEDYLQFEKLNQTRSAFKTSILLAEASINSNTDRFSKELSADIPNLMGDTQSIVDSLKDQMYENVDSSMEQVILNLEEFDAKLLDAENTAKKYMRYQECLQVEVMNYQSFQDARMDMDIKLSLWTSLRNWGVFQEEQEQANFAEIDVDDISHQVQQYNKVCGKAKRMLENNPVVGLLKSKVKVFQDCLPIVIDLRNKHLQERHWKSINVLLDHDVKNDENFTLGSLISMDAVQHRNEIAVISNKARQEASLNEMLEKVAVAWQNLAFPLNPYKGSTDVYVLGNLDEIVSALDESLVTVGTILGSPYVEPIRERVQEWNEKLMLFQDTLEEWTTCQRSWLYLETIFTSQDIVRQLMDEANEFNKVDRGWKEIMRRTRDMENAITAGTYSGLKETFIGYNEKLDKIQKALEAYLETKRNLFPRFYFLSNDELLKLLAQAKDPLTVQPHLIKCFDNIHSLQFNDRDIKAMYSTEGERVPLGANLKARMNVEIWLASLESDMVKSLKKHMKRGVVDYGKMSRRGDWVLDKFGQIVMTVSQIIWCRGCEQAIESSDDNAGLQDWYDVQLKQLSELTSLIRGKLTKIQRKKVVALITTDVHGRDVTQSLIDKKVSSLSNFTWQQQLRFYWDTNEDDCLVRQANAKFRYGYEYMGVTSRLVITPLTDRCWMTITGALHIRFGASPAGPAGTGKTESTKDLAKAMGFFCVVFNCSEQVTYQVMSKLFSGLAQTGAWTCLDEFNRIDIEVLSVVAQQLLQVRQALLQNLTKFNFQGKHAITLKSGFGCMITMNPGYAGRTELPDNLKVLFRPVAMMIPDYAAIAEIMLYAEGFDSANSLSKKMVKLYKLSSEQLSQQDHYDFGMRAVKSVLVMAGALKRAEPHLSEDVVLIRAMRDSNVPKFLAEDLPLFNALVQDLFPGVAIPDQDYGELEVAVHASLDEHGLQKVPKFVTKVIQLYETFNVRFGVMIVGPTGGGKSTCYNTLAHAMTMLREQESENETYQTVHTHVLNPKCITMGELYGDVDKLSQEWTDGLASTIMREAIKDTSADRHWVVFDGPVDSLWIENMNTVLDDNMTLCLVNGERMKLKHELRMLFEVQDLAVASPATVSRCGMVYLTPTDLGFMPYVYSWIPSFPESMREEHKNYLVELFETKLVPGLAWRREHCTEPIETVDINLCTSLCCIFEAIFTAENGIEFSDSLDELKLITEMIFCFSFIWAVGGSLDERSRPSFNKYCGDLFINSRPPGNVYDSYVDVQNKVWITWDTIVPPFHYDAKLPYFQMLVPTIDTVRHTTLMQTLLSVDKAVLFTGTTGVGKTVIIQSIFLDESKDAELVGMPIAFSAQTSAKQVQLTVESKLVQYKKTQLGAPKGKHMVIFVDDVNMPKKEEYGAQPPIELFRQFLDYRGFYDREKLYWKEIVDTTLVCACAPPGGGRNEMTPRFTRHFTVVAVPMPNEATLQKIFGAILGGFLRDFKTAIQKLKEPCVQSTIDLFNTITSELLPTPKKSHYTFNLRDISKVFQGILMIKPISCPQPETFVRLWIHESARCFSDRLIDDADRGWFRKCATSLVTKNFNLPWSEAEIFEKRSLMFGDFFSPGNRDNYEENTTPDDQLERLLDDYLEEYNDDPNHLRMDLVFFDDAIMHIARISRVLRQPRGNAMLVGVGGSGKQSLTRLASAISEQKCKELTMTRNFGYADFQDQIKEIMKLAGLEGKEIVFLLTDSQIIDDRFLEDINNVLNSGEVPNLMNSDDMLEIIEHLTPVAREMGYAATRQGIYNCFISRVRDNLHIVLCMSPVGEAFRARCRMFPSLINCCTVDWFNPWPESALISVSRTFLSEVELPSDEIRNALVEMCVITHTSVEDASADFLRRLRRHVYTTPKSFLDLIKTYTKLLAEKREEISAKRDHLTNGVTKIRESNSVVASLRAELETLQPILEQKTVETNALILQVEEDQVTADKVKAVVEVEAAQVAKQQEEVAEIQADAQADLELALPALRGAVKALEKLKKADIAEVKAFSNPPSGVVKTMEAVCVMLGQKPDWESAKKILSRTDFIMLLKNYKKDEVKSSMVKKVSKYLTDAALTDERMQSVSKAGASLMVWVRAIVDYSKVAKEVEPKRLRVAEMSALLEEANAKLAVKNQQLNEVLGNVAALQKKCNAAMAEKAELNAKSQQTARRLVAAETLTSSLGSEEVRWGEEAERLTHVHKLLVGDIFVSAALVSYAGGFTGTFRKNLVDLWTTELKRRSVPASDEYSLQNTLGTPVLTRQWNINGLPSDSVSVDNAVIAVNADRFPLMIDPQEQAVNWIKNEYKSDLITSTLRNKNLAKNIEMAIQAGSILLIEDVGETLDPTLDPVLLKTTYEHGGRQYIRLVDNELEWHPNFRMYITTKLPNPHYLPEMQIKLTLLNFTVTNAGLAEQLLGSVVKKEVPEVEQRKDRLVVNMANDQKQLADIEKRILRLLHESQGNILDDADLIATLGDAKSTSAIINTRVAEQVEMQKEITAKREAYRSAAELGSILYFVVADLSVIDPMYQFSLSYFVRLYNLAIDTAEQSEDLNERLQFLREHMKRLIYKNICRGLFERHKLLYSFIIATKIALDTGEIDQKAFSILLNGVGTATVDTGNMLPNPSEELISEAQWQLACHLESEVKSFVGFTSDLAMNLDTWREYIQSNRPDEMKLPGQWEKSLTVFEKLLAMKCLCPPKLIFAFTDYVTKVLGEEFAGGSVSTLEDVYNDTEYSTPIIFILSTGADPQALLFRLAKEKGYSNKIHTISLGQGQGEHAKKLVARCQEKGEWAFLQNCHLARSFMSDLEKMVVSFTDEDAKIHPDFRLWLTSMPADYFPVAVLQLGMKLTNEPPKGLRANLLRSYNNVVKAEEFETCVKPKPWKKLLFGLVFFYALIQERKKFGALGWNKLYEFNDSDLETSVTNMRLFLEEQDTIPWDALTYVCGEINFGGRVTDDWDRRCLMTNLRRYLTEDILDDEYAFSESGVYYAPPQGALTDYVSYLESLPREAEPEIFGMHENANITFQMKETKLVIADLISIQPRDAVGGGGKTSDEIVTEFAQEFERRLPKVLSQHGAHPETFRMHGEVMDSVATVLLQEMSRFNKLLRNMKKSLEDLQKAIRGEVVMSEELDRMYVSFLINQVPSIWAKTSYASLKPLGTWFDDLDRRVRFLRSWITEGEPLSFWMSAFFFPQGFLTGVLQNYARKRLVPIDTLTFSYEFGSTVDHSNIVVRPEVGVHCHGLYFDACAWDFEAHEITDSKLGDLNPAVPVIHFIPTENYVPNPEDYEIPVYKTSRRAGTLSTTGMSTNFVVPVYMPSSKDPSYYVRRGAAMLLQLDW